MGKEGNEVEVGLLARKLNQACLSKALLHGVSNVDTRGGHGSPRVGTLAGVLEWPFNGLRCVVPGVT